MRKVISNKLYDTETAKCIGSWDNGLYANDFGYLGAALYRKRTGEFFLHSEGGANTRYARQCGSNSWCGGDAIEPLGYEDARKWAEENLDAEEYEAAFGLPDEGEATITVTLSAAAKAKVERRAAEDGITQREVIEKLIETL